MHNQTDTLQELIHGCTPGQTLPQPFYIDPHLFAADLVHVFYRSWLFAGHTCDIPNPGDYVTLNVGDESLIVIRDKAGAIHAHFNVCRHRGSRLVQEEQGSARCLMCPYHQWVYGLDGQLTGARLMGDQFNKDAYQLHQAHVREVAGLLFVCLAAEPPDFAPAAEAIAPQLWPHRLDQARVICRHQYTIEANWKTIIENNRECYHCQVTHPEFMLSNYDTGLPGDPRQQQEYSEHLARAYRQWEAQGLCPREVSFPGGEWFRVARYPLKAGYLTESMDGSLTAPRMGDLPTPDVGSLRLIGLPNFWSHANADYAMTTRLTPLNVRQTRIDVAFLVRADAEEGVDYQPDTVAAVWKATSEEDWELCEQNYAGICSRAYQPGPLSPLAETSVQGFFDWYLARLQQGQRAAWRSAA